jgi:hypothetical protein
MQNNEGLMQRDCKSMWKMMSSIHDTKYNGSTDFNNTGTPCVVIHKESDIHDQYYVLCVTYCIQNELLSSNLVSIALFTDERSFIVATFAIALLLILIEQWHLRIFKIGNDGIHSRSCLSSHCSLTRTPSFIECFFSKYVSSHHGRELLLTSTFRYFQTFSCGGFIKRLWPIWIF